MPYKFGEEVVFRGEKSKKWNKPCQGFRRILHTLISEQADFKFSWP